MEVNEFDYLLQTARSVRRRLDLDRDVPLNVIRDCINVAVQAPVGGMGENTRYLAVRDSATREALAALYREVLSELEQSRGIKMKSSQQVLADTLARVPCLLFVYAMGTPGPATAQQVAFYGSVMPSAWSLMLALRARGIGSTWTTLLSARSEEVGRVLKVPTEVTQTVMLPIAYTRDANLKPADRLDASEVMYVDRWGSSEHV